MPTDSPITPDAIAQTMQLIRPHVRHTPVFRVDAEDFGLKGSPLDLKLEFMQHSGTCCNCAVQLQGLQIGTKCS